LAWVAEAFGLEVRLDESVVQITTVADGTLSIETSHATYFAYECIVVLPAEPEGFPTPPPGVDMPRVHTDVVPPAGEARRAGGR
jgi:hypothetical protein